MKQEGHKKTEGAAGSVRPASAMGAAGKQDPSKVGEIHGTTSGSACA